MTEKKTISKQYEEIIAFVKENEGTAEMVEFLEKRLSQHEKKNSNRKPTKTQEENAVLKEKILENMENDTQYTVTTIQGLVGLNSNQKTSTLLHQLIHENEVVREVIKGTAYFSKA